MVSIFYDSLCPVCRREISLLKLLDRKDRVNFIDITKVEFKPEKYDRTLADFVGTIHGQNEHGEILTGMPVFRMVYQQVGLGWLFAWTSWPLLRPVADALYAAFAKIRPRFSKFQASCSTDRCERGKAI